MLKGAWQVCASKGGVHVLSLGLGQQAPWTVDMSRGREKKQGLLAGPDLALPQQDGDSWGEQHVEKSYRWSRADMGHGNGWQFKHCVWVTVMWLEPPVCGCLRCQRSIP